jgi:hypothetical protein
MYLRKSIEELKLALSQFFKSSRDEKAGMTQAAKFSKL